MRILTSLLLAALVLTLPLTVIAAPSLQASIDIKSLALSKADLPRGFEIVPERTVSEEREDGVAVYDVTFARERTPDNLAAGPFEVRSGVARTAQVDEAQRQLDSTRDAFVAEGWAEMPVPALGDQALGLTQSTDGDGGKIAHYAYLFQKDRLILMVSVRGRPEATTMEDALGLAIKVSGRVDTALAGSQPAAASSGQPARTGSGERVRIVNADGGSVNVRAEPSTGAAVLGQVAEGTVLDVVGPNRDAEGRTWRNVRMSDGQSGWIVASFLETVAAPPPPAPSPVASPAPSQPAASQPSTGQPPASQPEEPEESVQPAGPGASATPEGTAPPAAPPSTLPAPPPAATAQAGSGTTFRGTGNGLTVEGTIRDAALSGGSQQVKVLVTRDGAPVADARVTVTARLDASRYRSIRAPRTGTDGRTEVEWEMEGPPGTYEVIVEARTSDDGPATTATGSFRWK